MAKPGSKSASEGRSREVRLGVVMFGGISLAVYINGVANELFRASRGRGVYRLLKALTDSEVVVDVVSGTSAGGINGILLSTALCNGTEFNDTGKLWRDQAGIGKLLRPVGKEKIENSVLSGEYHQSRMAAAFSELLDAHRPASTAPEDPSPVDELDLFITGTDIDGRISYRTDVLKHRIQLEDHHVLFQLKHRNERKEPFAPQALQNSEPNGTNGHHSTSDLPEINKNALATLAHITSCFPGAFVPLVVQVPTPHPLKPVPDPGGDVDGRLAYWGQLSEEDEHGKPVPRQVALMDGGVLKNKPFTSTIQAIFSRLADTQVSRYMLYVDPDPQEAVSERKRHTPSFLDPVPGQPRRLLPVAFAAASGLPRFESIDADLQSIDTHNAQVRRYEALVGAATQAVMANATLPAVRPQAGSAAYELARLGALAQFVEAALSTYLQRNNVLPGVIFQALQRRYGTGGFSHAWDVWFGFRRLIQLTYSTDDAAQVTALNKQSHRVSFLVPSRAPVEVERALITTLNRQIELYEILGARVEQVIAELASAKPLLDLASKAGWDAIEQAVLSMLARLPRPACFDPQTPLDPVSNCLTKDELSALRSGSVVSAMGAPPFLEAAEAFEKRLLQHYPLALPLLEMYQRFAYIDDAALPLALVSELKGRDQIHTVRVSPLDSKRAFARRFTAQHGQRPINKLCGMQLFDFGAFFKSSWRSNDLMWGRIDGMSQLLDILLDAERLARIEPAVLHENLTAILTGNWELGRIFPHSSKKQLDVLCTWLQRLANGDGTALAELRADDTLREAWAHAAQLEVLAEELPQVFAHAELELKGEALEDVKRQRQQLTFTSPTLTGAAIDAYFWPTKYKIGAENLLADIPTCTLLGYAALAGEHLRDALEKSLPSHSIPQHVFRRSVDAVLKASQLGGSFYLRWLALKAREEKAART